MLRPLFPWLLPVALVAVWSSSSVAFAQGTAPASPAPPATEAPEPPPSAGDGSAAPSDPNAVVEPKLLAFVDAGYPEAAREQRLEAKVLLVLTIGSDGFVEDAQLAGPAVGYGFDELALSASRRFVFEPASKGGEPMRARIRYLYEFQFQPAPEPAPTAAEVASTGQLELTLLGAQDGSPVKGAEVYLTARADPNRVLRLKSDEQGKLVAEKLLTGAYEVSVQADKFGPEIHQEEVMAGEVIQLTYHLKAESTEDEGYGAVARVQAPPREVTRRTIEKEELTRVAGTRGDALRTIELLPGVSRPPFGAGLVLIRGSAPEDSLTLLNGVPVPLLYHFGGLTSFINSRALQRIDFYPGNFSARYGRQIGGIIDVGTRDPATDKIHGVLDMNVPLDSSLLVEGPITKKLSFMVAGRRSYFGEMIKTFIPKDTFSQFAAPVYHDYQVFLNYRPTERDKIRFSSYGSGDRLEVLFADAPDDDPSISGIELGLKFHRQQIGWEHRYSPKLDHTIEASFGQTKQGFGLGKDIRFDLDIKNIYVRAEWRYNLTDRVQITSGTDTSINFYEVNYRGPAPNANSSQGGCNSTCREGVAVRESGTQGLPGVYTEVALRPVDKLRLIPSMRVDYFSEIDHFSFDPRFAGFYQLTKKLRLKAGVGVFSQAPTPPEATKSLGNPNLTPIKAIHYSAGVDYNFTDELSLGVEGFYKTIHNRVVSNDFQAAAARGELDPPPFVNDGIGRIYGLEVAGRKQAKGRWFGFLSYTLMRSERKDHNGPWYLFDFDQTHIFAAASNVILGRGWEVGAVMRFVSGNPNTPVMGAYYNTGVDSYVSVLGKINSSRAPAFNRLDLRAQKTWKFDSWKLALYLDIQNTYNARNVEGTTYSFNYRESADVRGVVIIPIIGLRGEL